MLKIYDKPEIELLKFVSEVIAEGGPDMGVTPPSSEENEEF